jgi:hypothetical protein
MRILLYISILGVLLLGSGCNGWDDDSLYANYTRAAFFDVTDPGGNRQLIRYIDGVATTEWNAQADVPGLDLGEALLIEDHVWLGHTGRKAIYQVAPISGEVVRRIEGLPIQPHLMAVGHKQLFVADTVADAICFVSLRQGRAYQPAYTGQPQAVLYNNSRFYLQQNGSEIAIYDESALALRTTLRLPTTIKDIAFDRNNSLRVGSCDSAGQRFGAIIDPNGDFVSTPNFLVPYTKVRYTPYIDDPFGSEFLKDLQLKDGNLETTRGEPLIDSIADFEADFFEGKVYVQRGDSLFRYQISLDSLLEGRPFPYTMRKAFFLYGLSE